MKDREAWGTAVHGTAELVMTQSLNKNYKVMLGMKTETGTKELGNKGHRHFSHWLACLNLCLQASFKPDLLCAAII